MIMAISTSLRHESSWSLAHSGDDHAFYELTLPMIMAILTQTAMNHSDHERWSWILWANPDDDQGDENLTQTWIIVIMSDDHEFYELTLTMIQEMRTSTRHES
jgi:hypothetical protein